MFRPAFGWANRNHAGQLRVTWPKWFSDNLKMYAFIKVCKSRINSSKKVTKPDHLPKITATSSSHYELSKFVVFLILSLYTVCLSYHTHIKVILYFPIRTYVRVHVCVYRVLIIRCFLIKFKLQRPNNMTVNVYDTVVLGASKEEVSQNRPVCG